MTDDGGLAEQNAALQKELATAVEQLGESLAQSRDLVDEIQELRIRAVGAERLQKEYLALTDSMAYRSGRLIVAAFTKPGLRTLMLPIDLVRLALERLVVLRRA